MTTLCRAFRPLAQTQNIAVTTTAQTVNINAPLGTFQIRFCNSGTQAVFILPGEAVQVDASPTNAIPLPAGQTEVFTFPTGTKSYSVIATAIGTTLYSTVGEGV